MKSEERKQEDEHHGKDRQYNWMDWLGDARNAQGEMEVFGEHLHYYDAQNVASTL